jgi:hypothetical protein
LKIRSPLKILVLFAPLVVLAAINLQLTPPSQTSSKEMILTGQSDPLVRSDQVELAESGSQAEDSLPPPQVKIVAAQESDSYAEPTPIAETGLFQVELATPTQTQLPLNTQSSAQLVVVPDKSAPEQSVGRRLLPSLEEFARQVSNGRDGVLTGVYVAGVMALKVLQQPDGDASFISAEDGTATQFQSSTFYGVVGLLAHNFLSGRYFQELNPSQKVTLIYGDGSLENYRITDIANFERLVQGDLRSNFRDLATDAEWTVDEVFNQFYTGDRHLTLQTCIEKDGVWNWGVQFIVADPVP